MLVEKLKCKDCNAVWNPNKADGAVQNTCPCCSSSNVTPMTENAPKNGNLIQG